MQDIGLVIGGLVFLAGGAEALIRGASAIALRLGLRPGVVGLTVVAWGTSFPELVVSVDASLQGMPDIALANVVGSNIYNIALILGLTGLISGLAVPKGTFTLDLPVMVGAAVALVLASLDGVVGRVEGGLLVTALVVFTAVLVRQGSDTEPATDEAAQPPALLLALLACALGMAMLGLGARWFTSGAVAIAEDLGVSRRVIGLTLVAFGTSLPELFTSVVAALRRQVDLAVSNVVGSNIMNVLGIVGIAGLVRPIPVHAGFGAWDYPWMVGSSLLLAVLLYTGQRLSRWEGAVLLVCAVAYTASLF